MLANVTDKIIYALAAIAWKDLAIAAIGSAAGAYWGALAAQRIAERAQNRERLLKQIRACNQAQSLAAIVCNSAVETMRQHIKPLKERFEEQRAQFIDTVKNQRSTSDGLHLDLSGLGMPDFPTDELSGYVFAELGDKAKLVVFANELRQRAQTMMKSIEDRNQWIDDFYRQQDRYRVQDETIRLEVLLRYFGLPYPEGHVDRKYADYVHNIHQSTSDVIYFSCRLTQLLTERGEALAAEYEKRFGVSSPTVSKTTFPGSEGLIPSGEFYDSWERNFIEAPARPRLKRRWWKFSASE